MSELHVTACIDDSPYATAVCAAASWASRRLAAPLQFVHVVDHSANPPAADTTGQIGLGAGEHLLETLAELDEARARVA